MISISDLQKIVKARIKDAEVLLASNRFDGAMYICGYAVEVALKLRICKTLKWSDFPERAKDFESYKSFKTHNLDVLLHLSGVEGKVKTKYFAEWSTVTQWNPEARYNPIGSASQTDAENMINGAQRLIRFL